MPSLPIQTIISGILPTAGTGGGTDNAADIVNPASVPAAQPATLTTRSSNTAGTLTMTNSNHGIVTGQRIDLYWSNGSCFGVIAGTVSGTSIPFTIVQGGNALPAATTAIIVGICTAVAFSIVGSNVTMLVCSRASAAVACYFVFLNALGVLALAVLNQAGQVYAWDGISSNLGPTGSANLGLFPLNPLAGTNPVQVYISHANVNAPDTGLFAAALSH